MVIFNFFNSFYIIFLNLFIYLFLAALGLRPCARAFSSCGEWGLILVAVHRLLIAVASCCRARALGTQASVVVAHGLSSCGSWALEHRLSSCGTRAQLLHSMWDLPGPGLEPTSPALAGGFLITAPPGKSRNSFYIIIWNSPVTKICLPPNLFIYLFHLFIVV